MQGPRPEFFAWDQEKRHYTVVIQRIARQQGLRGYRSMTNLHFVRIGLTHSETQPTPGQGAGSEGVGIPFRRNDPSYYGSFRITLGLGWLPSMRELGLGRMTGVGAAHCRTCSPRSLAAEAR